MKSFANVQAALIRAQSERTRATETKMREFGFVPKKVSDDSVWVFEGDSDRPLIMTFTTSTGSNPNVVFVGYYGYPGAIQENFSTTSYSGFAALIEDLNILVNAGIERQTVARFIYACNIVSDLYARGNTNLYSMDDLAYFVSLAPYDSTQQIKLMTSGFTAAEVKDLLAKGSPLALILELG